MLEGCATRASVVNTRVGRGGCQWTYHVTTVVACSCRCREGSDRLNHQLVSVAPREVKLCHAASGNLPNAVLLVAVERERPIREV